MAKNLGLQFAARTDTGLVRSQNEDAIAISLEYGYAILADGMGGYSAGEVASHIAISVTSELLEKELQPLQDARRNSLLHRNERIPQLLAEAVQYANNAILDAARAERQYEGMGTTIVAAVFHQDKVTVAHVGDSRAYRFRQGTLVQITRDHSLVQEQIDAGLLDTEAAQYSENKNLVTRAVGVDSGMEVEVHVHQAEEGDLYLLCSDGLSDLLTAHEISDVLAASHVSSLETTCDLLVRRANECGGRDNISVILIDVASISPEKTSLVSRIASWIK